MKMEEKLQQLATEIQQEFGPDSNKMFTILILMIFMDKDFRVLDYLRIPELQPYINFIEHNELLREIFNNSNNKSLDSNNRGTEISKNYQSNT